jgi:hypothetical protein
MLSCAFCAIDMRTKLSKKKFSVILFELARNSSFNFKKLYLYLLMFLLPYLDFISTEIAE